MRIKGINAIVGSVSIRGKIYDNRLIFFFARSNIYNWNRIRNNGLCGV